MKKPLAFLFPFLLVHAWLHAEKKTPPNFILYLTDDVSWNDLGCYGHPVIQTPHLDQMARDGIRFENAYLSISSCSPSRCSLITGRYPHNTGACELHTTLPADQYVFPEDLGKAGYYVALSGKHHMGKAVNRAFHKVSGGKGPGKQGDWVQILRERPKDKPFFCWFASSDAHRGWQLNDEAPRYEPEDVVVPPYLYDGPVTRKDLAEYYHEVSRIDHHLGLLRAELERQGIADETYVIFMTDNGRPFPRCKTRLQDSGIKTPFLVTGPDVAPRSVTESLISSIDLAATVLDLAGLPKAEPVQGVSFAPVLRNPETKTRDLVFAEHNWHVYQAHERLVRWKNWTLIRNAFPERQNLCMEGDPSHPAGRELWEAEAAGKLKPRQRDVFLKPRPALELYDVSKDPHQLHNLAGEKKHAAVLARLTRHLDLWAEQTADDVPKNITNDRQDPYKKKNKNHRRGDQPGVLSGSLTNNHPGPVLENGE